MQVKRVIAPEDVMPADLYRRMRGRREGLVAPYRGDRTLRLGPLAALHFESYETLWTALQESLSEARGESEALREACNRLIPQGSELVATLMVLTPQDEALRPLADKLGGIEETLAVTVGQEVIRGYPDRGNPPPHRTDGGRVQAAWAIRFPFTPQRIAKFGRPETIVTVATTLPQYGFIEILTEPQKAALALDFD